jgi:hypothetical protein
VQKNTFLASAEEHVSCRRTRFLPVQKNTFLASEEEHVSCQCRRTRFLPVQKNTFLASAEEHVSCQCRRTRFLLVQKNTFLVSVLGSFSQLVLSQISSRGESEPRLCCSCSAQFLPEVNRNLVSAVIRTAHILHSSA